MAIMTHAKFHFNWLMLTLIFGIWASEPPGPGERLKRLGLIGLRSLLLLGGGGIQVLSLVRHAFKMYQYKNSQTT